MANINAKYLETELKQAEQKVETLKTSLRAHLRALASDLSREIENLEKENMKCFNSTGPVQGKGSMIDSLTMNLYTTQENVKRLNTLIKLAK